MGTRNLTVVKLNGEYKIAQYAQWDGFPSGQGATILKFLHAVDLERFKEKVAKTTWITDEEYQATWKKINAEINKHGFVNIQDSDKHKKLWPELSRDIGAEILNMVYTQSPLKLNNAIEFAKNSLFCEWVYVIDFDNNTFEVYEGFNQKPLDESERFYFNGEKTEGYYPVKLQHSFALDNLPTEKEFLELCKPEEDDEEVV